MWDKHSGELIGFADLGDINFKFATLKNRRTLSIHVLVFLVKALSTHCHIVLLHLPLMELQLIK